MAILFLALFPGIREAYGGGIASVDPRGASADVIVDITGAGLDPVASNNRVVFTREGVSAENTAVTSAVDPASGLRRIGVPLPEGLPAGTAQIKVVNMTTGEVIDGASIEVIGITLEDVSAAPGTSVDVRITGTPNALFVANGTVTAFGDGIKVNSETVESGTSIVANITVSPDAAAGVRSIGLMTESQVAVLLRAFTVKEGPGPVATASGDGSDQNGFDLAGSASDIFVAFDVDNKPAAADPVALTGPVEVKKAANDSKPAEIKAEAASIAAAPGKSEAASLPSGAQPAKAAGNTAKPVKMASASITQTAEAVDVNNVASVKKAAPSKLSAPLFKSNQPENRPESGKEARKAETAHVNIAASGDTSEKPALKTNEGKKEKAETKPSGDLLAGSSDSRQASGKVEVAGLKPSGHLLAGSSDPLNVPGKDIDRIFAPTAEITVKDLLAPGTIVPPAKGEEESGLLRKLLVAFLGPFILIGYLISHIWK